MTILDVNLIGLSAAELPDGDYVGARSGYVILTKIRGQTIRIVTDVGVRGIDIPCMVRIRDGSISIEAPNPDRR